MIATLPSIPPPRPIQPSRRPRLGFLGVGWIGLNRLKAIVESDAGDVVAIADTSRDRAEAAARCVNAILERASDPSPAVGHSLEALLEQDLDGIVIATPSALHAEQALASLHAGVPVFCQKPLARNGRETEAVIHAARESDCLLGVDLSYRGLEGARQIRQLVQEGKLGKIYAVELAFHNAYGPDKPWFYDIKLSGGGCLIDLGTHLLDLAMWILGRGEVERVTSAVYAQGERIWKKCAVEDYAAAMLDLAGGTSIQLACSWRLAVGCDAIISASFYGTKGGAVLKNVSGSFYDFVAERCDGTKRSCLAAPPENWSGRMATEWARQLTASNRYDPRIEQVINVARTLDRIYGNEE